MLKNYFKTAWRNLGRNKIYSAINILGLALGLACTMLIILYVKDEVSYDRFHHDIDQVYRVVKSEVNAQGKVEFRDGNSGYVQGPRFTENIPEIKSFVRVQGGRQDIKTGTEISSHDLLYADSNFFSMFTFPLLSGNPRTCLNQPHSVVLSEDEAKNQFGTKDAAGKTLMLRDGESFIPYTVTAVARRCPQNSSIKFDILLPIKVPEGEEQNGESWFNFFLNTFVVLSPKADIPAVVGKMRRFYENDSKESLKSLMERYGPFKTRDVYALQPFMEMHLSKDLPAQNGLSDASNPVYSYILSGIALFILLIACINFVNLTVARSVRRAKEIGIRKVVGGERRQLIGQFMGESFLLCFFAFALAILLVQWVLPVFNDLSNKRLSVSYLFDMKLVTGYIVLFLLTGFLAGFYPALVLSAYNPVQTLYGRFIMAGKNYLQKSLVVLQFALASFLIIATFIIYAQFNYLTTEKLGYDDNNLAMVNKQMLTREEAALLRGELMKDPDITGVAAKNMGGWNTVAKVNGEQQINFAYETIDESYIPLLKIPLVEGRNFSKEFPADSTHSVIVNEMFVKQAGWKNPIGQEVNFWYNENKKYTVIGVVKNYHFQSLNQKIGPQLFTMKAANPYGMAFIRIRPNTTTASLDHITKVFHRLFPWSPYNYTFKEDQNRKSYDAEARWKRIMLFSAMLTIFISCIGLFGLSVLSAEKRTKEIGIRKVLGASVNNIATILSRDFMRLVIIALLITVPISWIAANKWLQNYPYRIHLSWQVFASAGILVVMIALTTVSFQAIKAAIASPVESLRTE